MTALLLPRQVRLSAGLLCVVLGLSPGLAFAGGHHHRGTYAAVAPAAVYAAPAATMTYSATAIQQVPVQSVQTLTVPQVATQHVAVQQYAVQQVPVQQQYAIQQVPVQQQYAIQQVPVQQQYAVQQVPVQQYAIQQVPVQQQYAVQQVPVQQQYAIQQVPVQTQLVAVPASLAQTNALSRPGVLSLGTGYSGGMGVSSVATADMSVQQEVAALAQEYPMLASRLGDGRFLKMLRDFLRGEVRDRVAKGGQRLARIDWLNLMKKLGLGFIRSYIGLDLSNDAVSDPNLERMIRDLLDQEGVRDDTNNGVTPFGPGVRRIEIRGTLFLDSGGPGSTEPPPTIPTNPELPPIPDLGPDTPTIPKVSGTSAEQPKTENSPDQ